jgi:hypothetical protein
MPPLRTYIFKCTTTNGVNMSVETHGTARDAFNKLSTLVQNANEWLLVDQK